MEIKKKRILAASAPSHPEGLLVAARIAGFARIKGDISTLENWVTFLFWIDIDISIAKKLSKT